MDAHRFALGLGPSKLDEPEHRTARRLAPVVAAVLVIVLAAASAHGGFSGTDLFLPMVGRQIGVGTSNWYTTVWIHNPGPDVATARIYLLERNLANLNAPWVDVMIEGGDTDVIENIVDTLFHMQVFGALRITCPTTLTVTSRVYSQAVEAAGSESVGQDFAGVPASFAIGLNERTQILGAYQTLPATASEYRFNFGFVETTGHQATVRVTAIDGTGVPQGSNDYLVREYSQKQMAVKDHFPALSTENARLQVEVVAGTGKVIAYGSGIANGTQDPTTFEMDYPARVLAQTAAGGITEVTAGQGLTGGGTSGAVALHVGAGNGVQVDADTVSVAVPLTLTGAVVPPGAVIYATNSGTGIGIYGESSTNDGVMGRSTSHHGVFGRSESRDGVCGQSASGEGVYGLQSSSGRYGYLGGTDWGVYGWGGVRGESDAHAGVNGVSGTGTGVIGSSTSGKGVYGTSGTANAVLGISETGTAIRGVRTSSHTVGELGTLDHGVFGQNQTSWAEGHLGSIEYGVYGVFLTTGAYGYLGSASYGVGGFSYTGQGIRGSSDSGYGVYAHSGFGYGVYGTNDETGAYGYLGSPDNQGVGGHSGSGQGVRGGSNSGYGVYGHSDTGSGVYGTNDTNGAYGYLGGNNAVGAAGRNGDNWGWLGTLNYAGYFNGNARVTGQLTKGSGAFLIDHPLDPENKVLYHSFVESPDMKNVYDGVAVLDGLGEAVVELPDWFEALNRDFRYQLTPIGAAAVLYVRDKISGNRFTIAGGRPGMEVSWQVTGIRRDAFANAHRIPVEEDKPAAERGLYLHPEAFGQPPERSVERAKESAQAPR